MLTPAKRITGLSSIGTLILLAVGGVLIARGSGLYGWWLEILGFANAAIPLQLIRRQRQMSRSPAEPGGAGAAAYGHDQVPGSSTGKPVMRPSGAGLA